MTDQQHKDRIAALRRMLMSDLTQSESRFELLTTYCRSRYSVEIALVALLPSTTPGVAAACADPAVQNGLKSQHVCQHSCALPLANDRVRTIRDIGFEFDVPNCPISTDAPSMRSYVGAPITGESGRRLGTLCLIDTCPRPPLCDEEIGHLEELAACVAQELGKG